MSSRYTPIDLSKLPAPKLVEELDHETIFQEMLADLQQRDPTFDALIESDPAYQILQVAAYRELLLRQTINDKAKARMLAYATGSDLDHVGADRQPPVVRKDGESDEQYRARIAMAPEAWSTAGPVGAYEYFSLSAHSDIKDVGVINLDGGIVQVAVLSSSGDGSCYGVRINNPAGYADGTIEIEVEPLKMAIPSGTVLEFESGASFETDADFNIDDTTLTGILTGAVDHTERGGILPFVEDLLSPDDMRPLNDTVKVVPATIIAFNIEAELTLYDGPDMELVRQAAEDAVAAYAAEQHRIGRDVVISGLLAALHQPGVQEVNLISPAARIEVDDSSATWCSAIDVTAVGRDE